MLVSPTALDQPGIQYYKITEHNREAVFDEPLEGDGSAEQGGEHTICMPRIDELGLKGGGLNAELFGQRRQGANRRLPGRRGNCGRTTDRNGR